jgi:site-specific recombinase XerD
MVTLKEAHQQFVENLEQNHRSPSTILAYGKDIEQLVDFLASQKKLQPHEVTKEDLQAFMTRLGQNGYTAKSISRKTNSTKTFFRFLKAQGYISDDAANQLAHPKFETPPPRILSKTEYRALRDACRGDVRTSAIVELLLQTGIRIGELTSLTLSDVHIDDKKKEGTLHVSTAGAVRDIPLTKAAVDALRAYLAVRPKTADNDTLFITKTGKSLLVRNIRTSIDRYLRIAGVKNARVNDLRHTWIAHHIKEGTSLLVISQLAGHKRLATTEKYLKYIEQNYDNSFKLDEL